MRRRTSANRRAAFLLTALGLGLVRAAPSAAQTNPAAGMGTNPPVNGPVPVPTTATTGPNPPSAGSIAVPNPARADRIQPLVLQGSHLRPCALNDNGQVLFLAANSDSADGLWQYSAGTAIPIAVAGEPGPAGQWKSVSSRAGAPDMNQHGDVVFAADVSLGNVVFTELFRWDGTTRTTTPLLIAGMPLGAGLIFTGEECQAVINNSGDVAFQATVQDPKGTWGNGVFLLKRDGSLQPVALGHGSYGASPPGGSQPQSAEFRSVGQPSINDQGAVAFVADGSGYLWEQGSVTPAAAAGTALGGWLKLGDVSRVWVNNRNNSVLVRASGAGIPAAEALFRSTHGELTPVVVPGQNVSGLGPLAAIVAGTPGGVSPANDAGEHALLAAGAGDSMAACVLAADGMIMPLLETSSTAGARAGLALIQLVGGDGGIALNNRGQVAVTVEAGAQEGIVLLTPQ